jgi:hypothetical protein
VSVASAEVEGLLVPHPTTAIPAKITAVILITFLPPRPAKIRFENPFHSFGTISAAITFWGELLAVLPIAGIMFKMRRELPPI